MNGGGSPGWLSAQLPRSLAGDDFVQRFVGIFEELADDVRARIDGLADVIDPGTAPADHLPWLAGWLGRPLDDAVPEAQQRIAVHLAGPSLPWRSTARGLRILVEAYTGAPATVTDSGGVHLRGGWRPAPPTVRVAVPHSGGLDAGSLEELIRRELPVGAALELVIGDEVPDDEPVENVRSAGPSLGLVDLQVDPSAWRVAPGGSVTCAVRLRNLDVHHHHFRVVVLGVPAGWWHTPLDELDVAPDGNAATEVGVEVPGYVDPAHTPSVSFDVGVRGSGGSTFATVRLLVGG